MVGRTKIHYTLSGLISEKMLFIFASFASRGLIFRVTWWVSHSDNLKRFEFLRPLTTIFSVSAHWKIRLVNKTFKCSRHLARAWHLSGSLFFKSLPLYCTFQIHITTLCVSDKRYQVHRSIIGKRYRAAIVDKQHAQFEASEHL